MPYILSVECSETKWVSQLLESIYHITREPYHCFTIWTLSYTAYLRFFALKCEINSSFRFLFMAIWPTPILLIKSLLPIVLSSFILSFGLSTSFWISISNCFYNSLMSSILLTISFFHDIRVDFLMLFKFLKYSFRLFYTRINLCMNN